MRARTYIGLAAAAFTAIAAFALDAPRGYLTGQPPLDYNALLADPPAPGSPDAATERAGYVASANGIGGAGWTAAITQLHPNSPEVLHQLACAAGKAIAPDTTPATVRLIANLGADLRGPTEDAKNLYHRDRPFIGESDARTCDPRTVSGGLSYAYPSGHAAFGELWGRAMSDALPASAAPVMAWGRSMGDNRIACRVHWPSDVVAGRKLADAIYARAAATPAFKADMAASQAELAKAPAASGC